MESGVYIRSMDYLRMIMGTAFDNDVRLAKSAQDKSWT